MAHTDSIANTADRHTAVREDLDAIFWDVDASRSALVFSTYNKAVRAWQAGNTDRAERCGVLVMHSLARRGELTAF